MSVWLFITHDMSKHKIKVSIMISDSAIICNFFCTCQLIVWSVSRYDVCGTEYKRICGYLIGLMFNWEKTFNYYYLTLPIHVCFYFWIELIFLFICVFWFHTSYGHRRLNVNTKLRNENDKKFLYWLCISGL